MKREDLLAKGYTEEQITELLNMFHNSNKDLKAELDKEKGYETKYLEVQKQLDEINKAKMTAEEKIEANKKASEELVKQSEENYRQSKIVLNKTKAQNVLIGLDIDDTIIDALVSDDEVATMQRANALKAKFDTYKDVVAKQTVETITNTDVKPTATNIPTGDDKMTLEKFYSLSADDQEKFVMEHPDEFENL